MFMRWTITHEESGLIINYAYLKVKNDIRRFYQELSTKGWQIDSKTAESRIVRVLYGS